MSEIFVAGSDTGSFEHLVCLAEVSLTQLPPYKLLFVTCECCTIDYQPMINLKLL